MRKALRADVIDEWTTIDVTKPHEAKAEEWRLTSKHDRTVEARFYESRVDSDWALELHCSAQPRRDERIAGGRRERREGGRAADPESPGRGALRPRLGRRPPAGGLARGRGAVLEEGAAGNAWWRRALRTDGAPGAQEQVLAAPTTQQFNAGAPRRGFEERCDSNVDAFARRVEAALRGVSGRAARRIVCARARRRARREGRRRRTATRNPGDGRVPRLRGRLGRRRCWCARRRRVDVITDAFAHLKSERQHLIEENAPVTRALCALAAHAPWRRLASTAEKNEAEALLNSLGAATTGESWVETSTDAGCKHELLQARRAMTHLTDALLKENEAPPRRGASKY